MGIESLHKLRLCIVTCASSPRLASHLNLTLPNACTFSSDRQNYLPLVSLGTWFKYWSSSYFFKTFGKSATIDGNVQGFCFSPLFGGRCSGIPRGCQTCTDLCQNRAGQQFSIEGDVITDEGNWDSFFLVPNTLQGLRLMIATEKYPLNFVNATLR